jgi:hypothetical protein
MTQHVHILLDGQACSVRMPWATLTLHARSHCQSRTTIMGITILRQVYHGNVLDSAANHTAVAWHTDDGMAMMQPRACLPCDYMRKHDWPCTQHRLSI